jgi:hypothetical protein
MSLESGDASALDHAGGATSPVALDCNNDRRPDLSNQQLVVRINPGGAAEQSIGRGGASLLSRALRVLLLRWSQPT